MFNPIAGKGAAVGKLPGICRFLESRQLQYEVVRTEYPGHAIEIAAVHAADVNSVVVAAGGDGTCNEVINGLMKGRGNGVPVFGVLPLGRGNDFSYGGRVPSDLQEALDVLAQGRTSPFDLGLIKGGDYPEGRYFGNGIGAGFDTVVGLEAARMKHVHDAFAYILGTVKTLIKFSQSPLAELSFNGNKTVLRAVQISIMNGRRMGGLFFMAPDAVNNDGFLDLCMVEHQSRRRLLKAVFHYTKGTQLGLPGITMDRSSAFRLKALDGGFVVHADGETICTDGKELEISCIPGPLRIVHK